jgi:signal transduction histidine kinase
MRWGIIFLIWTALGLMSAAQAALGMTHAGMKFDWQPMTIGRLLDWYTCALFTPAYIWLVRRYPVDRQHWRIGIPLLLVVTSAFVVIKYALYNELRVLLIEGATPRSLQTTLAQNFIIESIAFWALVAAVHAYVFYRRVREREMQEAKLRVQLAEARLDALSAQLHPHFLFNTLHGISTLMHRDVEAADTMLAQLSDLLRRTLESGERREVTVAEELDLLDRYLGIMRVRFGDRLTVEVDADPATSAALVPHFLLQPLVENALEHGIGKRAGNGRLLIRVSHRQNEPASSSSSPARLVLQVVDNGSGMSKASAGVATPQERVGLTNTRRRLATLYGDEQSLTLTDAAGGGLCVTVTLPYRVDPTASLDESGAGTRLGTSATRASAELQVVGD